MDDSTPYPDRVNFWMTTAKNVAEDTRRGHNEDPKQIASVLGEFEKFRAGNPTTISPDAHMSALTISKSAGALNDVVENARGAGLTDGDVGLVAGEIRKVLREKNPDGAPRQR